MATPIQPTTRAAPASAAGPTLADTLVQHVQAIDIPPRPAILDRIRHEMDKDTPNLAALSALIAADVSLAAGLLKTANSAFFAGRRRAASVSEALLMLGLEVSGRAIASICLRQAFPNGAAYERFWDASAKVAALSGWLCEQTGARLLRPHDAHTFGLFRDCGIVILWRRFPAYAQTLAAANQAREHGFTEVERRDWPTDHTVLGNLLAQDWWLPEPLCLAMRHHHDLAALDGRNPVLPPASRQLIALAQLAEHLLQTVTGASQTQEWHKLGAACLATLGLDREALPMLAREAEFALQQLAP